MNTDALDSGSKRAMRDERNMGSEPHTVAEIHLANIKQDRQ
jgi:hypothetical protein